MDESFHEADLLFVVVVFLVEGGDDEAGVEDEVGACGGGLFYRGLLRLLRHIILTQRSSNANLYKGVVTRQEIRQ